MEYNVGSKMFHGGQMKKLNSLEIFLYVSMFTLMLWKVVRNEFCKFCEFRLFLLKQILAKAWDSNNTQKQIYSTFLVSNKFDYKETWNWWPFLISWLPTLRALYALIFMNSIMLLLTKNYFCEKSKISW